MIFFIISKFINAGAAVLLISPGGAQVGMGMTGVSYPYDIAGIHYNPAIVNLTKSGVYVMNTPIASPWNSIFTGLGNNIVNKVASSYYTSDNVPYSPGWLTPINPNMKFTYGGIKFPKYKDISVALNFTMFSTGKTSAGDNIQSWEWITYDYVLGLSVGYSYKNVTFPIKLSAGTTLKYLYSFLVPSEVLDWIGDSYDQEITGGTCRAFTLDIGILISDLENIISGGVSYCNIVGDISYIEGGREDPLPRILRVGTSISPVNLVDYFLVKSSNFSWKIGNYMNFRYSWEFMTDRVGSEHDYFYNWGWELSLFNSLYFRKGYFDGYIEGGPGDCRGFGINLSNLRMDFSESPWHGNYRVSLNLERKENSNDYLAIPISALFPGAGHLYLGKNKRGLIYSGIGALFSLLQPLGSKTRNDVYYGAFYTVLLISFFDLIDTVIK